MELILPVDELFSNLRPVMVRQKWLACAYNGNSLPPGGVIAAGADAQDGNPAAVKADVQAGNPLSGADTAKGGVCFKDGEQVRIYSPEQIFIGIYRYQEQEQLLTVGKMFLDREEIERKTCNT